MPRIAGDLEDRTVLEGDDRSPVSPCSQGAAHEPTLDQQSTIRACARDLGGIATRVAKDVASTSEAEAAIRHLSIVEAARKRLWSTDEDEARLHAQPAHVLSKRDGHHLGATHVSVPEQEGESESVAKVRLRGAHQREDASVAAA